MGTDVFMWHGYAELHLDGRWFKLSSAFNLEMCERFGVGVLSFDGTDDALMHPYDSTGRRHMEYLRSHGSFDDLPSIAFSLISTSSTQGSSRAPDPPIRSSLAEAFVRPRPAAARVGSGPAGRGGAFEGGCSMASPQCTRRCR